MRNAKPSTVAPTRSLPVLALEQRMLLDGAALATAVDGVVDFQDDVPAAGYAVADPVLLRTAPLPDAVFIDTTIVGYESLLAGIPRDTEVFFIEGSGDGLDQMVAALAGDRIYRSIQVFSHGEAGAIQLGSTTLTGTSVDARAQDLAVIGRALAAGGDLLFFGCDVAATDDGKALIGRLADLTGADVAASTDTTGGLAVRGGNWELEYQRGDIQAVNVVDQRVLDAFSSSLLTGWTSNGSGSLLNSDNANNDEFGWSTAISDNSGMIAVGGWVQGDIYVYRPTGGGEYAEYKISPPATGTGGSAVAIDGNFLMIGYGSANKAYIYQWDSGTDTWIQRANLTGTGNFGTSVAIQADGTLYRAVVGAPNYNSGVAGQGGAQLYYSTNSGTSWSAGSMLSTNDGRFDSELNFGKSVAIDGNKVVVGAPGHGYSTWRSSSGTNAERHYIGRAYVYDWTSGNANIADTTIDTYLQADGGYYTGYNADPHFQKADPNGQQYFYFGTSVDISYNGANYMIAVGAPGETESYVWVNPAAGGATPGPTANQVSGLAGSQFGYSVGIDAYTGTLAVGAYNVGTDDGQVNIYKSTAWTTLNKDYQGAVDARWGWSVAVARDVVVIGSPWGVAPAGNRAGLVATYIYNSAPAVVSDSLSINEGDVSAYINVLANDSDPNYAGPTNQVATASGGMDVPKLVFVDDISAGEVYVTTNSLGYGRIVFDASTADLDYLQVGESLAIPVYYTMVDAGGESLIGTLNVTVNGRNDIPTAADAIALQVVNSGVTNYLFTNNTNPMSPQRLKDAGYFADPDATESHTYQFTNGLQTYTPAGGPTFTINATTGEVTVTGIAAGMIGTTYNILGVKVTDSQGGFVNLDPWQCRVDRPNTSPTATGGTLGVTAYEDNFKPGTYSQSGTTVTVTSATHGLQVGDLVALDYINGLGVDASYVVATVPTANTFTVVESSSQVTSGNLLHTFGSTVDMSVHFSDADFPTEEFSYSLIGAPGWITISPVTGELSLSGGNNDIPTSPANFTVRVTDQYLRTADKLVTVTLTPVNDAPAVTNEVSFTSAYLGQAYANTDVGAIVKLPADLFTDIDLPTPNSVSLKAYVGATEITASAGSPSWLRFDAVNGRFYTSGNVSGNIYEAITVRVVATDNGSPAMSSEYYFDINLFASPQVGGQVAAAAGYNAQGHAVAVSENGLWMAVGEPEYAGAGYMRGQVSIYNWGGAAWNYVQTIAEPSPANDERFGYSLDLSNDGERLIVGAPGVGGSVGAVYSYQRSGGGTFGAALATYQATAGDRQAGDSFGFSVALNRDGSKFVVGAIGDDAAGQEAGAAYLFNWGTTTEVAKRLPVVDSGEAANSQHYDRFGWSVAFDGNVVVVGAPFDSVNNTTTGELMQFNGSVTVLGVAAGFNGAVIKGAGQGDYDMYGWSVSVDAYRNLAGDAANSSVLVAVGAPGSDLKDTDAGAVYLYRWAGISDTVNQTQLNTVVVLDTLTAFDGQAYDGFGSSVAIDAQNTAAGYANDVKDNGVRLAVGSKLNGDLGGTAYLYRARTDWSWLGQTYTQSVSGFTTTPTGNQFGWAVALSNAATSAWNAGYTVATNAGRIAIGAPGTDKNADYWGRYGSVHWATSATTRIETEAGLLSGVVEKLLDDGGIVLDADAGQSDGDVLDPRFLSSPQDKFYDGDGLNPTPVSGQQFAAVYAAPVYSLGDVSLAGYGATRHDLFNGSAMAEDALQGVDMTSVETSPFVAPAVDDPLLFLLQTTGQAVFVDEDGEQQENGPAATDGLNDEEGEGEKAPTAAVPILSKQLHVLGERYARASADLLGRLEKLGT